jgi:hypothetical protein
VDKALKQINDHLQSSSFPVRSLKSKYKKIFETNLDIMRVTKDNLDKQCHVFRKNLDIIHPPSNQISLNNEEHLFSTAKSKSLSE